MLKKMFEMQKMLQNKIREKEGRDKVDLPIDDADEFSKQLFYLSNEIAEIAKADERWKSWKNHPKIDKSNKLEEIVDALHFLINIALYSGFDYEDVEEAFLLKNQINEDRTEDDY